MANFTVQAIVSTTATGFVQGGDTAIFTELAVAQELRHRIGEINRIAMSATGGLLDAFDAEQRVLPRVNSSFDAALLGIDAGLDVATIPDEFSLAVQSTAGDGLLSGVEVESLRENLTTIAPDASVVEMLMAPLAGLSHEGVNLTGLLTAEVNGFVVDDVADWYATPAGLSVQKRETSQWFQWIPPDEMDNAITGMVSVGDGAVLSLHSSGVRFSALSEDIPSRDIDLPDFEGEMVALAVTDSSGVPYGIALQVQMLDSLAAEGELVAAPIALLHGLGFVEEGNISWNRTSLDVSSLQSIEIESGELAVEGDQLLVRLEAALSSYTCAIPLTVLSEQSTSCAWQEDPSAMRHLVEVGGAAWDQSGQDLVRTLSRLSSLGASAHDLGLPAGDVLSVGGDGVWVDGPGLYIFNGINFVNATLQPPAAADGNAVWSDGSRTLASGPDGAFIVDENGTSGRLPYQHSVDEIGRAHV